MYIGKKLKEFRISKELSQSEIAKELDVSQSYYSSVELSKKPVTKKILKKIEEIWGTKKEFFKPERENGLGEEVGGVPGGVPFYASPKGAANIIKKYNSGHFTLSNATRMLKDLQKNYPTHYNLYSKLKDLLNFEDSINVLDKHYFQNIGNQLLSVEKYGSKQNFDYKSYKEDYLKLLNNLQPIETALNDISAAIERFYSQIQDFDKHGAIEFLYGEEEPINEEETTGDEWQDFQNARNKKKPLNGG